MMNARRHNRASQSGNIFFMLFASVALVGAFGVAASNTMKGMVASMSDVTRKQIAEEKMMAGGRLAIQDATATQTNDGDCDNDGTIEPLPYRDAGTGPKPAGGGYIPLEIGATETDPWGTPYGYCVWDAGSLRKDAACGGAGARRLSGAPNPATHAVIAVISAGKDRKFTTTCNNYVDTTPADGNPDLPLIARTSGGDDVIMEYTYNDASGLSGDDLWKIRDISPDTAMIDKNIEVGGGADFSGPMDLQKKGLLLPEDPGDNSVTGPCTAINDQELRINSGNNPPVLEICYENDWVPISMGESGGACGTWTLQNTGAASNSYWYDIVYGNNQFVAVGYGASGAHNLMTSPDGISWTLRTVSNLPFGGVAYGNGLFAAVSNLGIMTSPDGVAWTTRTKPAGTQSWGRIIFANGTFVAIANTGTNQAMTSSDGITWTARAIPSGSWNTITYGNGLFVAAGQGTNRLATSPDGITWTARSIASGNYFGAAYGNGKFVLGDWNGPILHSTNGITWTAATSPPSIAYWASIMFNGERFVAVSYNNGTQLIASSEDGVTWSAEQEPDQRQWRGIAYGKGKFVVIADDFPNVMISNCAVSGGGEEEEEEEEEEQMPILPDPIAQYQLDETTGTTIYDSMNGLSGTLSGAINPTSNTGKSGRAIDFDGVDDRVAFATQAKINGITAMTISGWMRQDAGGAVQYIYNTRNAGSNGFHISTSATAGQLVFTVGTGGAYAANTSFTVGTWAHFAVTYNAAEPATAPVLYINGATKAWTSSTAASAYTAPAGGSWIGSTSAGGSYFNGALDDIRVFDRILNPAQIDLLYRNLTPGVSIAPNPAAILGVNKYRGTISIGETNACMVRTDGTAACWGAEPTGALGNGAVSTDQASPSRVETLTTPNNFVQVSTDNGYSCGLKVDGSAWCWGDDTHGKLGNGATAGQQDNPSPVSGGHIFSMLSVSAMHACGLRADGQILCWGNDTYGQLGNGGGGATTSPGLVTDAGPWVYVSAGHSNTCGIKVDGSGWCWGNTNNGRNGEGTLTATNIQVPTPIAQAGPWVKIDAGFDNACGVKLDGTAWCWGSNSYGKLGIGQSAGNYAIPQRVHDLGPWIDIDTGYVTTTCGVKIDGTAWCWGHDGNGQLGNGAATTGNQSLPVMVSDPGPWASVVASSTFACGVKADGTYWCWGSDANGRLGNGTVLTADQTTPSRVRYSPDDPAFSMNTADTALVKNANATSISIGTTGRIGYDGMSGFGFTSGGNPVMSGPGFSTGLGVEASGAYDAQISLKTSASSVLSIGVDNVAGNLEFGFNDAGATNMMSTIAPKMEINRNGYLGLGTSGTIGAKLHMATGGLKVGNDTRDCTLSRRGVLRFNTNKLQFCDGSAWKDF